MSDVPEAPGWWQASDGRWYPPEQFGQAAGAPTTAPPPASPPPPAAAVPSAGAAPVPHGAGAPVLCTVGDISVTGTEVITPAGRIPLRHTTWMVSNMTTTSQGIPTWAIVLAIVFAVVCLLGLLFLLVKEERTTGVVQVSVQADGFFHATQIPIASRVQVADVENRVNYIRSLVASAP